MRITDFRFETNFPPSLSLRNEGALSPVGLGDMGPVCSVLGRGDELEAGDLAELSTILELAVKAHSRVHVPSASMMDAFILKIMDGFSFYEATPAPQEPSLPCASEIYEYSDDSGGL